MASNWRQEKAPGGAAQRHQARQCPRLSASPRAVPCCSGGESESRMTANVNASCRRGRAARALQYARLRKGSQVCRRTGRASARARVHLGGDLEERSVHHGVEARARAQQVDRQQGGREQRRSHVRARRPSPRVQRQQAERPRRRPGRRWPRPQHVVEQSSRGGGREPGGKKCAQEPGRRPGAEHGQRRAPASAPPEPERRAATRRGPARSLAAGERLEAERDEQGHHRLAP